MVEWNHTVSAGLVLSERPDSRYSLWMRRHSDDMMITNLFPHDMEHLIRDHWRQFQALSSEWYFATGVIMSILGLIGLLGNFLVIYVFLTTKYLRRPSNMFIVNLAFSDFMMMFIIMPMMVVSCFKQKWILGPLMCEIYGACGSGFGSVSIISMTAIAMNRYRVVVKGLSNEKLTYEQAILWICLIWIYVGLWTSAPFFGWSSYVLDGNFINCSLDSVSHNWNSRSYVIGYCIGMYFLPLCFLTYTYYHIVKTVTKQESVLRKNSRCMNIDQLEPRHSKITVEAKFSMVALITVVLWFVVWTPYTVLIFLGSFTSGKLVTPLLSILVAVFAKCASFCDPIVYGISHPKYREALRERMPKLYKFFSCGKCRSKKQNEDPENQHDLTTVDKKNSTEESDN